MNKRSALVVSAGLVLTLVAGGLAVVIGMTGPTISSGSSRTDTAVEPLVRTVRRTITVRRQAKADTSPVVQLSSSGTSASGDGSSSSSSSSEGPEREDHGSDDPHESDDEGSESQGSEHEDEHEQEDSDDD